MVVPVFNEAESVQPLYNSVAESLEHRGDWELIFVDDGSLDETVRVLEGIVELDPRVRVVEFRRNYGQTPAMAAGIQYAQGEVIVTMDGDLQNDPSDIPRFLEQIEAGYDIVLGWRENRQDALITRKLPSWIANRIIGKITGVPVRDNGCSLKAYRSAVIKEVPLYSELHRFIPAMASLAGTRTIEIPVRHHPRAFGESKYGLKRIYKVVLDLIVVKTLLSMMGSPIKFFARLAVVPALVSGLLLLGAASSWPQENPSLVYLGTAVMWGSASLFSMGAGLLAELLYRTSNYKESYLARLTTDRHH